MKTVIAAVVCSVASLAFVGCQSSQSDDVKTTYRSQYATAAADVKTTTEAAKSVLTDMDLKNVTADATSVDGKAMGKMADNTDVKVYVNKDGNMSKIQVTVGLMGDPSVGTPIADKIKNKAEGMKMDDAKMP